MTLESTENLETRTKSVLTIRTSQQGWLAELAKAYRNRDQIIIIDDANVGIDPSSHGAAMIILAIVDPDPTSKLGLLIGSGAVLFLGGGFSAIRILANRKPPKVRVSPRGIEIEWD